MSITDPGWYIRPDTGKADWWDGQKWENLVLRETPQPAPQIQNPEWPRIAKHATNIIVSAAVVLIGFFAVIVWPSEYMWLLMLAIVANLIAIIVRAFIVVGIARKEQR